MDSAETVGSCIYVTPEPQKPEITTNNKEVEAYVRAYFKDIPIMAEIARCETRFRHWEENGEVKKGTINPQDRGVMQINEYYHLQPAIKLGYDIYSLQGNLEYARYLYNTQGTRPWLWSSSCWANPSSNGA